jgi:ADP-ribosylglycohydrolase
MSRTSPWARIDVVKDITLQQLASRSDPELSPVQSVAIVESICSDPSNCDIIRYLAGQASGHLFARAVPTDVGALPATEEAWHSLCDSSHATLSSCIGSVMSMLIADGLGHSTEFHTVDMERKLPWMPSSSYAPQQLPSAWVDWIEREQPANSAFGIIGQFRLKPGQWTDDSSMGLCLLDTLLAKPDFDAMDCMMRFVLWTALGYNNAFGFDKERRKAGGMGGGSVGLGGNISMAISQFLQEPRAATSAGDFNTNGNGSVMRLCPVAVRFWRNRRRAMDVAAASSLTTHRGIEASMCCRLLAFVTCAMIESAAEVPVAHRSQAAFRALFDQTLAGFIQEPPPACDLSDALDRASVSSKQTAHDAAVAGVLAIASSQSQGEDRNWNWRDRGFRYSLSRSFSQGGYVGSYCMDAMAMAFYRCYHSADYTDAVRSSRALFL